MTSLTIDTQPGRQRSTLSLPSIKTPGDKPIPHSPGICEHPSRSIPYAEVQTSRNTRKTFHLPLAVGSPGHSRPSSPLLPSGDPERQPLLSPTAANRKKLAYPVIMAVMAIVILGILVGVGGWGSDNGGGKKRHRGGV